MQNHDGAFKTAKSAHKLAELVILPPQERMEAQWKTQQLLDPRYGLEGFNHIDLSLASAHHKTGLPQYIHFNLRAGRWCSARPFEEHNAADKHFRKTISVLMTIVQQPVMAGLHQSFSG